MHMFNHQTHHRGQVHAMLTAAGQKTDDTDYLWIMAVIAPSRRVRRTPQKASAAGLKDAGITICFCRPFSVG